MQARLRNAVDCAHALAAAAPATETEFRGDCPQVRFVTASDLHSPSVLRFLAFLDVRPIAEGHALVVPKREIDNLFDLPDDLLGEILLFARPVARALERVVPCRRIGLLVAGLEVPHAHVHLVPIRELGDLNFARARPADPQALDALAARVRAAL